MTRRSYVQIDGVLYDKADGYSAEARGANGDSFLWNDRAYQDMNDPRFNSRSSHRQYMKDNKLTTIDDLQGDWKRAEKNRIDARKGVDPERKHDIARAIERLKSNSRR